MFVYVETPRVVPAIC